MTTEQEKRTLESLGRIIAECIWDDIQNQLRHEKNSGSNHVRPRSGVDKLAAGDRSILPDSKSIYVTDEAGNLIDLNKNS